jgi:hypothetical protein
MDHPKTQQVMYNPERATLRGSHHASDHRRSTSSSPSSSFGVDRPFAPPTAEGVPSLHHRITTHRRSVAALDLLLSPMMTAATPRPPPSPLPPPPLTQHCYYRPPPPSSDVATPSPLGQPTARADWADTLGGHTPARPVVTKDFHN